VVERLATLADLRERGMLDDGEYGRAKAAGAARGAVGVTARLRVILLLLQAVAIALGIRLGVVIWHAVS
jgi:hypothetical protein